MDQFWLLFFLLVSFGGMQCANKWTIFSASLAGTVRCMASTSLYVQHLTTMIQSWTKSGKVLTEHILAALFYNSVLKLQGSYV